MRKEAMTQSLLKAFRGPEGRRHLIDALIAQPLIRDKDLAQAVEPYLKLAEVSAGTTIIEQGDSDADLVLILKGECSIAIDGHIVARKKAGEHLDLTVRAGSSPSPGIRLTTRLGGVGEKLPGLDRFPQLATQRRIAFFDAY
ncbi:MAG TPA: hypothetical protein VE243_10785 [Candidatus Acidoferrum sp.]|nr:hypothetical protein [Candidatus Acidoferrum sp.]